MKKITKTLPADYTPESIMKVKSILVFIPNSYTIGTEHIFLEGDLYQRLKRYKELFGKEWSGNEEETVTEYIQEEIIPYGNVIEEDNIPPQTKIAQDKINQLAKEAREFLINLNAEKKDKIKV